MFSSFPGDTICKSLELATEQHRRQTTTTAASLPETWPGEGGMLQLRLGETVLRCFYCFRLKLLVSAALPLPAWVVIVV